MARIRDIRLIPLSYRMAQLRAYGMARALTAERALVTALDASCHTPIGAHARDDDGALLLSAFVGLPDGSHWIRDELVGAAAEPAELGTTAAERLAAAGARELLKEAERAALDVR